MNRCWPGSPESARLGTVRLFFQEGKGHTFDELRGGGSFPAHGLLAARESHT